MRFRLQLQGVTALFVAVALVLPMSSPVQADSRDRQWPARTALGCPAPTWPSNASPGSPGEGRRVLVIGDSLTRESRQDLVRGMRAHGWTPTIRCWGGKRLDWGLAQLKRAKALGQLPEIVVLGLGTNDMRWIDRSRTRSRLEQFVKAVGPKRQLIIVGTYANGADRFTRAKERWFNDLAERVAVQHPHVHALGWGSFARANGVKFRDGLHYTRAGERTYANFIVEGLDSTVPLAVSN